MHSSSIGLIAAMPEEVNPLLQLIGAHVKETRGSFDCYLFQRYDRNVTLIRSGMGVSRAAAATEILIETAKPGIVINFGFAGAVKAGPKVGDLMLAEQILSYDGSKLAATASTGEVATCLHDLGIKAFNSTFITTHQITEKQSLAKIIPEACLFPAVEMESAAVAHVAAKAGIPFRAIRAISDAADEELGFGLDEFTDREMNIRIGQVLKTVAKKPWIIPQLLRLAGNSRIAGKNLARALDAVIKTC